MVQICELIKFDSILVIDEKGDLLNEGLHLYVDYKNLGSPFEKVIHVISDGYKKINIENENCKRIKFFPDEIPIQKEGVLHKTSAISIDKEILAAFKDSNDLRTLYDADNKYNFLNQNDIIQIIDYEKREGEFFEKITTKYNIRLKTYLDENADEYYLHKLLKKQLGEDIEDESLINV
jgi:hypothetical protein